MTDKQIIQKMCRAMQAVLNDINSGTSLNRDHKSIQSIQKLVKTHRKK